MGKLLSPEELEGAKPLLTAEDLEGAAPAKKSKYADPKSFHQTDEELQLSSGLQGPEDTFGNYVPPSPLEQRLKGKYEGDTAFLKEIAPYVAGGFVGKGLAAVGSRLAVKPASAATREAAAMMAKAIHNTHSSSVFDAAIKAGILMAKPQLATAAELGSGAARATAAGVASSAAGATSVAGGAKASGPMSNMIERLRASPLTNVRAQELMAKIDALQNAGTGAVTQSTLGAVNE